MSQTEDESENATSPILEGEVESEQLSDEETIYQINTYGADFTVDGLVKRFDRGDIFRPKFQRNFVWTWPQASKFIESILLGLPIPSVFLYREESTQKHLIVDGLQRLTTLASFSNGRLPHNDRVFRLRDVKERFEGRTFKELEPEDQRRFEDAVVHAMIIQQLAPDDGNSAVFHIFDRLNSNGTPLQPQEIRAAVYHGPFQDLLGELNLDPSWRAIFGAVHKRAKDHELILRFLALAYNGDNYEKPMKGFLNSFMEKHRHLDQRLQQEFASAFTQTIRIIHNAIGEKAFRPARSFNVSAFDSVMLGVFKSQLEEPDAVREVYQKLLADPAYQETITGATSDETVVEARLAISLRYFNDAA
ncbi:DUF262 domain-containing protein [Wenxinia saemankumensis]|uniref:GmrSD restriction endonucleases N-terminal domain-containing protein n=1 Tax=Wenxinia saemankumensis TaxID=1447782 RepID=A0A1M6G7X8_9RHOB|nr:DUF262 domain-containing protein [Wenxinia saemankumensis]SHJ06105.1 Protein of unknown function DUF262 [Wenxinia saemankumensis]